jgi:glucose-6-phosphate isomerase
MALGALCDREYSFDYEAIRKRKGLAWYPVVSTNGGIEWIPNPHYKKSSLDVRPCRDYPEFGLARGRSLYGQAVQDLDRFAWVSKPALRADVWKYFVP